MLKIRLQRVGKRNQPYFRLVLTPSTNAAKGGEVQEILGNYDPVKKTKAFKADRIKYWLSVGAQLSDTANNLLINEKIIEGAKKRKHPTFVAKEEVKPVSVGSSGEAKEEIKKEAPPADVEKGDAAGKVANEEVATGEANGSEK